MLLNPLLSKVKLPGRVFQLPSKGLFYPPGVLADTVKDGEVQVTPMSALAEIKLRSADLLISSKIISEVCAECVPEVLKPSELLAKDVDAIFLFLVISTYGTSKTIRSRHDCAKAEAHDYVIDLEKIASNPNNDGLAHRDVLYSTVLDNNQKVILKPISFSSTSAIVNLRTEITKLEKSRDEFSSEAVERLMFADMLTIIDGVYASADDPTSLIKDESMIRAWLKVLSRKHLDQIISASTQASTWGFSFDVDLTCRDCNQSYKYELDLNPVNFFNG